MISWWEHHDRSWRVFRSSIRRLCRRGAISSDVTATLEVSKIQEPAAMLWGTWHPQEPDSRHPTGRLDKFVAVSGKGSKFRTQRIQAMGHFFIRRLIPNIIKYPGLEYPKGIPMSAHFYDFKTETDVHWEGMSLLSVISQVGSIFTTTRKIKHKIEPNIINYPMI